MSRLFDVYLAIDWSARSQPSPEKPSKDAIWIGERVAQDIVDDTIIGEVYKRTRFACITYIRDRLHHHVANNRRIFIGFDFGYGYPKGFVQGLGLKGEAPPWKLLWDILTDLIEDNEDNDNNRFEVAAKLNLRCGSSNPGPLWGCPAAKQVPTLTMKMHRERFPYPAGNSVFIDNFRWSDKRIKGVQPIWKLIGSGSVGGQSLVGIPAVNRLRFHDDFINVSKLWPFETGFTENPTPSSGPFILHVEIWPGIVPEPLDEAIEIRDKAQVRGFVNWLERLDSAGKLGTLFGTPENLPEEGIRAAIEDEGWIFGAGWGDKLDLNPTQLALF